MKATGWVQLSANATANQQDAAVTSYIDSSHPPPHSQQTQAMLFSASVQQHMYKCLRLI